MKDLKGYWSVAIIRETPYQPHQQILKLLLDASRSFNPAETQTEKLTSELWQVSCNFCTFIEASNNCQHWEKLYGFRLHKIFIGAWDNRRFIDIWSDPEKRVQAYLHEKLGGSKEVKTPLGRIDLLTDSEIIEIKLFKNWKSALGQVLVYAKFYPSHQKRLYLFERKVPLQLNLIKDACADYGVLVDFEIDRGWRHVQ
jgi:hypothetical protein